MLDEFDSVSADWRANRKMHQAYLAALAARLMTALPGLVQVERQKVFFKKSKSIAQIQVSLGEFQYQLSYSKNKEFETVIGHSIRGIVLKNECIPLAEWLVRLNREIKKRAEVSQSTEDCLSDFLL